MTDETMETPPAMNCCRPPDPMQPQLHLNSGETRAVISPRSFGWGTARLVLRRIENQGCGQHAQVVELPRIYVWIITSRNSAYKERARLHHHFLCKHKKNSVIAPPFSRARPSTPPLRMRSLTCISASRSCLHRHEQRCFHAFAWPCSRRNFSQRATIPP